VPPTHGILRVDRIGKAALKESKVASLVLYSSRHTSLIRPGASGCDVWTLMGIAAM
jgi:hypothetical protein